MAPSFRFVPALIAVAVTVLLGSLASTKPAASAQDLVRVVDSTISLATPPFVQVGKRYALTFPGGGPAQTHTIRQVRPDGWVLVDVADENIDPALIVRGEVSTRWLHIALATSIQEMRPFLN
jgi:hypothetical protein